MASLSEIRAKLKEQETRGSGGSNGGGDNGIFAFWNMKEGQSSTIRFLPDGNDQNTFFWVERAMIKLPFAGIKGEADSRPTQVQVPCMEMYGKGEACPILSEVRGWFKDPALEDMGRKYWKKKSYIAQGLVVATDMQEETSPENPIRRFIIGPQVYQLIKSALLDPDLEDSPTDYTNGLDFRLIKTGKGGYADYGTSNWARKVRPLNDTEMASVNRFGLFNLNDFIPKKPGETELKVIKEMFEASVDGEAYDAERWGQYFKPAGLSSVTGDPTASRTQTPAAAPAVSLNKIKSTVTVDNTTDGDDIPFETESALTQPKQVANTQAPAGNSAENILAMIRARSK